jgi:predicted negative regulator of RcsB-dependent stress response
VFTKASLNSTLENLNLLANPTHQGYFVLIIMENTPIPIAELDQGPSKFEEFLDKNQKKLVILAILIFVGVLAYVLFKGLAEKNAVEAGAAFMQATDEESLRKIISDHSSSTTAGTAAMAISQLRTTDEDRIKALEHFINTYPDHTGVPAKLLELALIQMNTGNNKDAENTLNKLILNEKSAFLAPRAKIALADIAASENELKKAEQIYTEIKDSQTHFAVVAAERLTYLKAKDPVLVKKKPSASVPDEELPPPATPIEDESTPSLELELPSPTNPKSEDIPQ